MSETERAVTLISLLRRTAQRMVDEITTRLERRGHVNVPPSYHPVFENIDRQGTRLTALAARAGLTHQSMGEVVAELERRGFVERVPDPVDGRARLVRLTAEGRRLVQDALREIAAIESEWLRRWRAAGLEGDLRAAMAAALNGKVGAR